jgi:DNA-directed RNA polymerase subunit RPC12/RpoP
MNISSWLLGLWRSLLMWDYICPKCKEQVERNNHKCPHCGEQFGIALRVPPKMWKDPKALEKYVHEKVFPRVSAWQQLYLAQYFTTIFAHGFEGGNFGNDPETGYAWDGTDNSGGTPTVSTNYPHHGTYSARFQQTTTQEGLRVSCYKDIGSQPNILVMRQYVYFSSFGNTPSGGYIIVLNLEDINRYGRSYVFAYNDSSTWKWALNHAGDGWLYHVSSSTVALNTWYCVEEKYDNANHEIILKINATAVVDLTNQTTYNDLRNIASGTEYTGPNSDGADFYVDCVKVADIDVGPDSTNINVSDSGLGSEVLSFSATLTLVESGSGSDVPSMQATLPLSDSGIGTDAPSMQAQLLLSDSGSGLDSPSLQAQLSSSDSGIGVDGAVASITLTVSDSGSGVDSVSQLQAQLTLADSGVGSESFQLEGSFTVSDSGVGSEAVYAGPLVSVKAKIFLIIGDLAIQLSG